MELPLDADIAVRFKVASVVPVNTGGAEEAPDAASERLEAAIARRLGCRTLMAGIVIGGVFELWIHKIRSVHLSATRTMTSLGAVPINGLANASTQYITV